jgi:hypothetical protein
MIMSASTTPAKAGSSNNENGEQLLRAAVRLNTWMLAGVLSVIFGFTLFGVTYWALLIDRPGPSGILNLLGVFLPGYEVSHSGAWVGLFWGAVIGALCAVVFYRLSARRLTRPAPALTPPDKSAYPMHGVVLLFNGTTMGVALGLLLAAGLFASTNWLVLRGTADSSVHAMLISNYLPGYTVSLLGSLVGAAELFVLTFIASWLFCGIYNRIVKARRRQTR